MERLQRIAGQRPDFQVASTAGEHTRVKVEAAPSLALLGSHAARITVLFGMRPLHGWRALWLAAKRSKVRSGYGRAKADCTTQ
jgi:hypothetical protein